MADALDLLGPAGADPSLTEPQRRGTLASVLDWFGKPGYAVRDLLAGNPGGAGRQAVDFLTGPLRALIPGDQSWATLARPEDEVHASDLAHIDRKEHPFLALGADLVGDTLTDPLTYLTFGAAPAAKAALEGAQGAAELGGAGRVAGTLADTLQGAGTAARDTTGLRLRVPFTSVSTPQLFAGHQLDPLALIGQGANAAAAQLPQGAQDAYEAAKLAARKTLSYLDPHPAIRALGQWAQAKGNLAEQTAVNSFHQAMEAGEVPDDVQEALQNAINNVHRDDTGAWRETLPEVRAPSAANERPSALGGEAPKPDPSPYVRTTDLMGKYKQRLDAMPLPQETRDRAKALVDALVEHSATQFRNAVQGGVFSAPSNVDLTTHTLADYTPRMYQGLELPAQDLLQRDAALGPLGTAQRVGKERTLEGGQELADFLNEQTAANPDFRMLPLAEANVRAAAQLGRARSQAETLRGLVEHAPTGELGDAATEAYQKALAEQAPPAPEPSVPWSPSRVQATAMAQRADATPAFLRDGFTSLQDPEMRQFGQRILGNLKDLDPDSYATLLKTVAPIEQRGPVLQALAGVNNIFKKAAVYSFIIPKTATIMRNVLSHPQQAATFDTQAGLFQLQKTPETLWHVAVEGLRRVFGLHNVGTPQVTSDLDAIEHAVTSAKSPEEVSALLRGSGRDDLASAVENNVIGQGFVQKEAVLKSIANSSWGRKAMDWANLGDTAKQRALNFLDAPPAMFRASEDAARLMNYQELLRRGYSPADAASGVKDMFYDYDTYTKANRTLRDIIPFAGFTTQAARASAKWFSMHPVAATAANALYNQRAAGPVYPYLEDENRIPLGSDSQGNALYASGLEMPFEALNAIPNVLGNNLRETGEELRKGLVSSANPLVKTAYGLVTGRDPFFDSHWGEYDKVPLLGNAGAAGSAYNVLAGTGFIQPLDTPLRILGKAFDPQASLGERAVDLLSGANLVHVDPVKAAQQQIEERLALDPQAREHSTVTSDDPRIRDLQRAVAKAKREKDRHAV